MKVMHHSPTLYVCRVEPRDVQFVTPLPQYIVMGNVKGQYVSLLTGWSDAYAMIKSDKGE